MTTPTLLTPFLVHFGFTGPRQGMTAAQRDRVALLVQHADFYAHHGDCVGSDATFDAIVRAAPHLRGVIIHPSTLTSQRAYCQARYPHDVVREPKDPLARNRDIVDESHIVIATPSEGHMVLRSGTWATIRYARQVARPLWIVLPNGGLLTENCRGPLGSTEARS